jgi:hypothetical protein
MANSDPEILVVGAGPVGLTAALELARRGFAARIIDNDAAPTPESRALGVNARTLELLEPSGATERLLAHGLRMVGLVLRMGGQELARVPLSDIPHRFNFMLSLPQSEIERLLIEALADRGIAIDWRTRLQSLDGDRGKPHLPAGARRDLHDRSPGHRHRRRRRPFHGAQKPRHRLRRRKLPRRMGPRRRRSRRLAVSLRPARDHARPPQHLRLHPDGRGLRPLLLQSPGRARPPAARRQGQVGHLAIDLPHQLPPGLDLSAGQRVPRRRRRPHPLARGRPRHEPRHRGCLLARLADGRGPHRRIHGLRWPAGRTVLDFTEQQTRQIVSRGLWADVLRRWLAPAILKVPAVRRRLLARVAGLDTPPAPWLGA